MAVLQRPGDQLGLARGAAIDQRDDRLAIRQIARGRGDMLCALALAALDDRDVALVDERVGHLYRVIKAAAGVVAQIDDEPDQLVAGLRPQILDRGGQGVGRPGLERGQPDIADIARFRAASRPSEN